jgi:hypothetical protein
MLLQAKADGSHLKTLNRLAKTQLLILDDLFLTPLDDPSATTCSKSSRIAIGKIPPSSPASARQKLAPHLLSERSLVRMQSVQ